MLINKTKNEVEIRYDNKNIVVKSGASLDVREYGVLNKHVEAVEKHICNKNPGVFDIKATEDVFKTNTEALETISKMKEERQGLIEQLEIANSGKDKAEKKMREALNEVEGLKDQLKAAKKDIAEWKAKFKAAQ